MDEVTVYYLEMLSREQLQPLLANKELQVHECEVRQFQLNRFMYQLVGQDWQWQERLSWPEQQWRDYAERDELHTWLALSRGSPAGYYELEKQNAGDVEIKYFGLATPFIGKGFGGCLLRHALHSAWNWDDTRRVLVNTCTLDHPGALGNYQARGMKIYKTEVETN